MLLNPPPKYTGPGRCIFPLVPMRQGAGLFHDKPFVPVVGLWEGVGGWYIFVLVPWGEGAGLFGRLVYLGGCSIREGGLIDNLLHCKECIE